MAFNGAEYAFDRRKEGPMVKADGGRLTTHVLDTASGLPAAGLPVAVSSTWVVRRPELPAAKLLPPWTIARRSVRICEAIK